MSEHQNPKLPWNTKGPPRAKGEYVVSFKNTANKMTGFHHINITKDGTWTEGGDDDQVVCFGPHIVFTGWIKLDTK